MGEIVYQYDNLDKTHHSESALNLSCICCEDTFSYLIHAEGDAQLFRAKTFSFDKHYPGFSNPLGYLSEVFREDHLLFHEFQTKTIAIRGVPFVSIVQDQLIHENWKSFLADQTDLGPNDTIHTDLVGGTGYALIFAIPELLNAEIQMYYKDARIRHSLSGLLCHALSRSNEHQSIIHANISHRWLEIVIVENNNLKFINQMRWYDLNDVVYYIAAVLENLQIDHKTAFEFSGSAYHTEMQDHLINYLSIDQQQIVNTDDIHLRALDLRTIGSCE